MNIAKLIKVYFIFLMTIVSIAALSYNDSVEKYLVSVIHIGEDSAKNVPSFLADSLKSVDTNKLFVSNEKNQDLVGFYVNSNSDKFFATPGSTNVEVMNFVLKSKNEPVLLSDLNLKIVGIDPKNIENIMLINNKNLIERGKISTDGYVHFEDINFKIPSNSDKTLSLYANLSKNLHTGERIRLDIEKPEDIKILVDGKDFNIKSYYPIKGFYLSIAKDRAWGLNPNRK